MSWRRRALVLSCGAVLLWAWCAPAHAQLNRAGIPDFSGTFNATDNVTSSGNFRQHELQVTGDQSGNDGSGRFRAVGHRKHYLPDYVTVGLYWVLYEPDRIKRDAKPQLQYQQKAEVFVEAFVYTLSGRSVASTTVAPCKASVKIKDSNKNRAFDGGDDVKWKVRCPSDVLTAPPPSGLGLSPAWADQLAQLLGIKNGVLDAGSTK